MRKRKSKTEIHPLDWVRTFIGPAFFIGGWGVISTSFALGVLFIYVGLIVCFVEVCLDPMIIKRASQPVHLAAIGVVLFFITWFTVGIVLASAPMNWYAYAMRKGNRADGEIVEGITWNSHFTELTVAVMNPSADDYKDLDIEIQPDKWSYKAAILNQPSTCDLIRVSGPVVHHTEVRHDVAVPQSGGVTIKAMPVGDDADIHDDMGNTWTVFAGEKGYRLRCGRFPAHFTVYVIFALVALPHTIVPNQGYGFGIANMGRLNSPFDILDIRPSPSTVTVTGGYTAQFKSFWIQRALNVKDGD